MDNNDDGLSTNVNTAFTLDNEFCPYSRI